MDLYKTLMNRPPKLSVAEDAREVMIHTVSCMCDNKALLTLKKNSNGEFKLNSTGQSLGNFQFKCEIYEIEWAADSGEWDEVFRLINTGTALISKVISR